MIYDFIIPIVLIVAVLVSAALCLIIPDTARCPKCGVRMEPYDDKRDFCANPNCPTKT